jgi:diazepam-binding inhibitor (GABA receptor modulating acyl-CoA-binding protein)
MPVAETKRKSYIRSKSLTMEVKALFEKAIADSKALPEKPSNETLLNLYSLYKQSTEGDVKGEAPAMFDFVAKAKYESWSSLKGKTQEAAMQEYINLVEKLKA